MRHPLWNVGGAGGAVQERRTPPSRERRAASVSGATQRNEISPFTPTTTYAVSVAVLPAASVAVYVNR